MKRLLWMLCFCFLGHAGNLYAQVYESAGDYLQAINKKNEEITTKYMVYLSAVSHGKSARKVEKRRTEVVNLINNTRFEIMGMPPWKGDRSFKDSAANYLKLLYTVFNEDYGKIVNMEEIAEQSYDMMEAYMLAQEKAYEKLGEASEKLHEAQKQFAAKNNINLLESTSEVGNKAKTANEIMKHCNEVYLIFYKPYKQEGYLIEAMNQKNLVAMEQNINSLKNMAEDGVEKIKKIKGYNNDASLIFACRNMLQFYKSEAAQGASLTDFFLKEESFVKIKKQFESKPTSKRTQQDIDQYNNAVNDMNAASKVFNATNNALNKERTDVLNDWNKAYNKYLDDYMPKQARQ
ncbi:MAG TPA: hypothetical protein VLJ68_02210 [Chitinophagaceae bacterium]|nr:hypothetical protein [Chitinophagaceae bacterium]